MRIYRIAQVQVSDPDPEPDADGGQIRGYPYYLAIYQEGRFKGQYPPEIAFVPNMKKMWDEGKLGTGRRSKELRSPDLVDLVRQVRQRGLNPQYDDIDFFIVRRPNTPREKITLPHNL